MEVLETSVPLPMDWGGFSGMLLPECPTTLDPLKAVARPQKTAAVFFYLPGVMLPIYGDS